MQKKKSEIFNIFKQEIYNNIKSYVIVTIIFVIGLFLGVFIINTTNSKENISQYINTYIDEMKTLQNGDFIGELKNDIQNNILLVFLLWFAGTTIIGIPIVFGIILTRGFCLGYTISACVLTLGKLKVFMFILFEESVSEKSKLEMILEIIASNSTTKNKITNNFTSLFGFFLLLFVFLLNTNILLNYSLLIYD